MTNKTYQATKYVRKINEDTRCFGGAFYDKLLP